MATDIYKNIKKRRKLIGMTQEELAKKTGYNGRSMIAMVEAGKVNVPPKRLERIAEALECTVEYFYNPDSIQSASRTSVLIRFFSMLSNEDKDVIINMARLMAQKTNTHSIGNNLPEGEEDNGSEVQNNN